jgi:hypothetical protein
METKLLRRGRFMRFVINIDEYTLNCLTHSSSFQFADCSIYHIDHVALLLLYELA